jgi:hypothetical protein
MGQEEGEPAPVLVNLSLRRSSTGSWQARPERVNACIGRGSRLAATHGPEVGSISFLGIEGHRLRPCSPTGCIPLREAGARSVLAAWARGEVCPDGATDTRGGEYLAGSDAYATDKLA